MPRDGLTSQPSALLKIYFHGNMQYTTFYNSYFRTGEDDIKPGLIHSDAIRNQNYCSPSSQENAMYTRGSFYSVMCLINLKENTVTINTMQINNLRSVPKDNITG